MKYAIYAFIVSAVVTIALGPVIIPMLRRMKFGQNERSDGPQSHLSKAGTPTMGGMMFIAGILVGTLAFSLNATELALPALDADTVFCYFLFQFFFPVSFISPRGRFSAEKSRCTVLCFVSAAGIFS